MFRHTNQDIFQISDPDAEAPNLANIRAPDHFDLLVSIIEELNISTDFPEEEDWDQITRGAIASHEDQVIMTKLNLPSQRDNNNTFTRFLST